MFAKRSVKVEWLSGVATALVTPFTQNGAIDEERFVGLVERQISAGIRLLIPCSTTGESATMTAAEDRRVMRLAVEASKGRARIIAGLGNNATNVVIDNALAAKEIGVDAVKVVAPYYNKPMQDGLFAHYEAIAHALGDLPVILYNIPTRTSSNILPETVRRLAVEVDSIVGLQESSRNLDQMMTILRDKPDGFKVFAGDDDLFFPLAVLGLDGVVSVLSNIIPKLMLQLWKTIETGNWEAGRQLHNRLLPLMRAMFMESNPLPVKAALAMMNLLEENYRLPLVSMDEGQKKQLRTLLAEFELVRN